MGLRETYITYRFTYSVPHPLNTSQVDYQFIESPNLEDTIRMAYRVLNESEVEVHEYRLEQIITHDLTTSFDHKLKPEIGNEIK